MEVSDQEYISSVAPKYGASEASTQSTTNLSSPITGVTCFTILVESSRVAQKNSESCRNLFDASVERSDWETDYMQYGLDFPVFTITTADDNILRYCVPMDNQRPQLDLKFYKDICPDENGASLRTFMAVFNTSLWSPRHCSVHQIWPVLIQCCNAFVRLPKWVPG